MRSTVSLEHRPPLGKSWNGANVMGLMRWDGAVISRPAGSASEGEGDRQEAAKVVWKKKLKGKQHQTKRGLYDELFSARLTARRISIYLLLLASSSSAGFGTDWGWSGLDWGSRMANPVVAGGGHMMAGWGAMGENDGVSFLEKEGLFRWGSVP